MDDWNVHDIVVILLMDAALVEEKTRFCRFLHIPVDSLRDFEHRYQQHSDSYSYFCDVLEKWKSINRNATIPSLINILKENKFATSADRLTNFHNGISTPVTVFGVKDPVFNFVGRERELNQLNEWFTRRRACIVLSSAMGGKGKTELCRRFIQQLPKDVDTLVTWISGDGQQQIQQSLSEVGQEMKVSTTDSAGKPLSVDKLVENIASKRKSKWLVIIDNVDEVFQDFFSAVESFLKNEAFVVVTSRRTDIEMQTDKYIFLKDLEDKDARELVRTTLDNIQSQKLVDELCKSLQNYPLALQQAVAFIEYKQRLEDESYGIEEYLKELNLDNSKAFDHTIPSTGYPFTIVKIFELTLSKVLSVPESNSLSLLHILSLVQPDGISKEFLKEMFSLFELEETFESSLSTLKSFSLIGVNKDEIFVHRIVQKLTRERMKTENKFISVINKIFEKLYKNKLKSKEIFHVIQIWKNGLGEESEIIRKNSNFAVKICNRLRELSRYRELKDFSEITLKQFAKALRPDHIDILRMQFQLGMALEYNGEYNEALAKLQEVWEKRKKVLGEDHEATLNCAGEIATVLWLLKRFDESLEWYERVLKSQVKIHVENHKITMATKNNMANVLNDQGKIKEALSIYKQVLEWKEKELGHEHPETFSTRHNIATCLFNQGKFVEAMKEFEEVLRLMVKVLGVEHADTLITKSWLSYTLHSLREKDKAVEMLEQVLISQEKVLGQNHPTTNMTRDNISKWRMYQNFKNKCTLY